MKITAEFNNGTEMFEFAQLILGQDNAVKFVPSHGVEVEPQKEDTQKQEEKPTDLKKEIIKTMIEEGDKALEDTKETQSSQVTEDKEPKVTKEMVRAIFVKFTKANKQNLAKELLLKYGVSKVSEIKEEDYVAILKEAEELM